MTTAPHIPGLDEHGFVVLIDPVIRAVGQEIGVDIESLLDEFQYGYKFDSPEAEVLHALAGVDRGDIEWGDLDHYGIYANWWDLDGHGWMLQTDEQGFVAASRTSRIQAEEYEGNWIEFCTCPIHDEDYQNCGCNPGETP
ncbi:MAG: hypothetical protein OXG44_12660 [Gammaproteobacteria bacterium]|nr:hypothetical protein [Gammaproteobacteria bacterium]